MNDQDRDARADGSAPEASFAVSKVMVVGRSHVTCVVVSSILEKSGLKATAVLPETAEALLDDGHRPAMIVLDGGADNRECDTLAVRLSAMRQSGGRDAPSVVLLSNRNHTLPFVPSSFWPPGVIDAVVAKPITPERLQVVVRRLLPGVDA